MQRILALMTLASMFFGSLPGAFLGGEEGAWTRPQDRALLGQSAGAVEKAGSQMDPNGTPQGNASPGAGGGS